jgi:hypothetical protein
MAANRQKKAQALAKARAKVKQRKQQRDQYQAQLEPDFAEGPPILVAMNESPDDVQILGEMPGVEKMSAVLIDFIEPWRSECETVDDVLTLARLAALAWNSTLLPLREREKMLRKLFDSIPIEGRGLFAALIERKRTEFPENDRFILDVKLQDAPSGPTLLVESSFTPPET